MDFAESRRMLWDREVFYVGILTTMGYSSLLHYMVQRWDVVPLMAEAYRMLMRVFIVASHYRPDDSSHSSDQRCWAQAYPPAAQ